MKYFQLMIELDEHEANYLSICKHFRAIYDTEAIKKDAEKNKEVKQEILVFPVGGEWCYFCLVHISTSYFPKFYLYI